MPYLLRNNLTQRKTILTRDLSNMMYSNTFSYIAHVHESGQKKKEINTRQVFIDDGSGFFLDVSQIFVLFLVIEFKVEIRLVKLIQTNVTIFTTACVRLSVGMEGQRIDWTEMALNTSEFFFENQMEETGVEFADTR